MKIQKTKYYLRKPEQNKNSKKLKKKTLAFIDKK